jgi:hypothetical protein
MKVEERSNDALIIRDGPWQMRAIGAAFSGGSIAILYLVGRGHRADPGVWVAFVVCAMFALAGSALLILAADRRWVLDRRERVARIVTLGIRGRRVVEYPLASIRDVALETGGLQDRDSAPTYRPVFLMQDGSRVPWLPYFTGARGSQATCVAAAREFGEWKTEPADQTASASPDQSSVRSGKKVPLGCVAAFLSIFVAVGTGLMAVQVYRLTTWRAVPALVLSTDIQTVRGSKGGSTYRPTATYRYVINGDTVIGNGIMPISVSAGYSWAQKIESRYVPGRYTTAYVDPRHPGNSFLLHEATLMPVIFIGLPLIFGVVLVSMSRWAVREGSLTTLYPVPVIAPASGK